MHKSQEVKDNNALLEVIRDLVTEEQTELSRINDSIAKVSQLVIAVSNATASTKEQVEGGHNTTQRILKQQQTILTEADNLHHKLDSINQHLSELEDDKHNIVNTLTDIIKAHEGDHEELTKTISELYIDYTNKMVELSTEIRNMNGQLADEQHLINVTEIRDEIVALEGRLRELNDTQSAKMVTLGESMKELLSGVKQLHELLAVVDSEADNNKQTIQKIVSRLMIIETRLDTLIESEGEN